MAVSSPPPMYMSGPFLPVKGDAHAFLMAFAAFLAASFRLSAASRA